MGPLWGTLWPLRGLQAPAGPAGPSGEVSLLFIHQHHAKAKLGYYDVLVDPSPDLARKLERQKLLKHCWLLGVACNIIKQFLKSDDSPAQLIGWLSADLAKSALSETIKVLIIVTFLPPLT